MLNSIKLANFKCFDELNLKLSPLTLLSGVNNTGKSSVLQALLLLRQSYTSGDLQKRKLNLSGNLVEVGTANDILFENAECELIEFEIQHKDIRLLKMTFDCTRDTDQLNAPVELITNHSFSQIAYGNWNDTPPLGGNLVYINAERVGPRKIYSLSESLARRGDLGSRGEHALNYLMVHQDDFLPENDPRCSNLIKPSKKIAVINDWLQRITPDANLELKPIHEADVLLAGYSFDQKGDVRSNTYRATNVGFGLSYTLPVLVALLSSPGTMCIIENPEAHLHPKGQTEMAEIVVSAVLAGVQVIVETHSDHFLDGIRINVKKGMIEPNDVSIHYFHRTAGKSVVTTPKIDTDGRLSDWPAGFFDQYEENLGKLITSN